MAWGTPASLAAATTASSGTTMVISCTVAASSLILVTGTVVSLTVPDTVTCADDAGNTYTIIQCTGYGALNRCTTFLAYAYAANALSGQNITVTTATIVHGVVRGWSNTGNATSSIEDTAAQATGTGTATTSPTLTSGTPAVAGDFFFALQGNFGNNTTYTEDSNWTNSGNNDKTGTAGTDCSISSAWLVDAGTSTHTHAPTTSNLAYGKVIAAFKVAASDTLLGQAIF